MIRVLYTNFTWLTVRAGAGRLLWVSIGYRAEWQFSILPRSWGLRWNSYGLLSQRIRWWQVGPLQLMHHGGHA